MVTSYSSDQLSSLSPGAISDELEKGQIVYFPECPYPMPTEVDMDFLRQSMPDLVEAKNVSFHPEVNKVVGLKPGTSEAERAGKILQEHSKVIQEFLNRVIPSLTKNWVIGTSSFRPLEEKGRHLSAHASNELVHVDAGAYGATHGDRVLRVFLNINPTKDRVWITKGIFSDLYKRWGKKAGIIPEGKRNLKEGLLNQMYSGALTVASKAGLSRTNLIDTSPYDRLMRKFHNFMKDTPEFQNDVAGHQEIRFKPFSAWMVFTDTVSHACVEGQFAFVDTFIIPLQNCQHPERAPINILRNPAEVSV